MSNPYRRQVVERTLFDFNFLTDVVKLYHIYDKAFRQLWKSFLTAVKNMKSNGFTSKTKLSKKESQIK